MRTVDSAHYDAPMTVQLNPHEARVLGVLIEKAFTTPDQYPLSLNGATLGSNQKSNRNPVLDFSEAETLVALQGLQMKQLAGGSYPAGSRVEKWHHNAREHLGVRDEDVAVLAELLLRGPQSQGELRTRASRMRTLASADEVQQVLERLIQKGYAKRVPPAAGSRAERFAQLLAPTLYVDGEPEEEPARGPVAARPTTTGGDLASRVTRLEADVATLRRQLSALAEKLGEPLES